MSILLVSLLSASVTLAGASSFQVSLPSTIPNFAACSSEPSFYSCENTTEITNTCCSPTPGGLVLQTQFWSTYTGLEKKGQLLPKESWTIHGLWPDFCDGDYTQYCDLSRQYDPAPSPNTTNGLANGTVVPPYTGPGVDTFIHKFGRHDLLDYMNKYWINQGAPNNEFWAHEFSKHATCTSTFDISCYDNYQEHEDVVNFFDAVIRAFKMYPTYDILASAGIIPSNSTTYTLSQIQNALKSQTGAIPHLGCSSSPTNSSSNVVLSEVWYYTHVLGTEQYGRFKPVDTTFGSNCKSDGILYLERSHGSEREVRA
ncbi:ribonuclease T2 [Pyrrhoderma noxium]|uniref:ribonuclease T2 n=1 Tax=Pyrrhoderma noxium TaxID=2282107 RepID=A0A286USF5_9AGAM|nr:ribonuclease T2 [Pyrrhoderma noxium]